ncbi:Uncharacterized membrane protein YwzB [[Clostridium] ultunense Esp]|uniref:DUF1146 family protein n=1 Tax=Thermicanus aegyptius TaxID=94009 RepID=UPI0002B6FD22|nr:DUF1146 family protein [Thermicanus aegyptius]CCQ95774.1 Uncharacterized membrane protein YwzB [[Clostridium] ultunense Esp]
MDTTSVAVAGVIQIILSILFIALSWWALQGVRWDIFLLKPNSPQAKILVLLLSILIGAQVALFFSNYFNWSSWIKFLF